MFTRFADKSAILQKIPSIFISSAMKVDGVILLRMLMTMAMSYKGTLDYRGRRFFFSLIFFLLVCLSVLLSNTSIVAFDKVKTSLNAPDFPR